jgi:hypothetical protein
VRKIFLLSVLVLWSSNAFSSELEDLARDGYAVVETTQVDGDFEGCDFNKRIPLTNGLIFVCSEYNYSYAYMPEVLILKQVKSGDIKVLIDDEEYEGALYQSQGVRRGS